MGTCMYVACHMQIPIHVNRSSKQPMNIVQVTILNSTIYTIWMVRIFKIQI